MRKIVIEMPATYDLYEKVMRPDGSVHMMWVTESGDQGLLCGASKAAAARALPADRVSCSECRRRAMAIVAGEESPR